MPLRLRGRVETPETQIWLDRQYEEYKRNNITDCIGSELRAAELKTKNAIRNCIIFYRRKARRGVAQTNCRRLVDAYAKELMPYTL
jgi:hypothetical protein